MQRPEPPFLLGIDVGSTSLKAVVYDLRGRCVARGSRPTERVYPDPQKPHYVVWDPDQIWGGVARAVREAVSQLSDPRSIRGCAVTGMGMDGLPVAEDGHYLYPFISWHDTRTLPQLQWWLRHVGAERTFARCGNPVWAINSALRILWIAENEPEILRHTHTWLLIEDFVNFKLTGKQATDFSMASCTLLFDQKKRTWCDEILSLAGIDRRLLPDPHPSGTALGEVTEQAASDTGLPQGTPVLLGGHDHLCGALPVGAFQPEVLLDVTGTWESVIACETAPPLTGEVRRPGLTVQAHVAPDRWAVWGATPAGENLEWYRHNFGLAWEREAEEHGGAVWDHLVADASKSPPGARGVMFLPHLSAAGCPINDNRSRGAFVGLSTAATAGDLARAIFEGLNYQFRHLLESLSEGLGKEFSRIVCVGGAVKNPFWIQNKADVLGRELSVPDVEEATPLGAAMLAGVGLGLYRDVEDAYRQVKKPEKRYLPDPERARCYRRWFPLYRRLYPSLRELHHSLTEGPESSQR